MEHPGDRILLHLFHKILNGQAGVARCAAEGPVRVFKNDVTSALSDGDEPVAAQNGQELPGRDGW